MSRINVLFEQMNPKRYPDEYKADDNKAIKKDNIEQMDYYAILGIKREARKMEIKRAYQKKLKRFHPDKTKPTKENKLKYKLIREAGDTLIHPQKRKAYDTQFKMNNTSQNFISQKESFNAFMKLQEHNMTDEDRKIAKLNFTKSIQQMNKTHGIDIDAQPLTSTEYNRRMEDVLLQREQEEFEMNQDNMFEGKKYTSSEFNNIFENKKQKDKKIESDGLILFKDEIQAYSSNDNVGVSLDNYDSLYADGIYNGSNETYAGIGNNILDNESDDISIDSLDDNDYKLEYKVSNNILDTEIKTLLSERETQDSKFTNMTDVDFGSAINDEYGISKQFGFMIGNDRNGQQKPSNKLTNSTIKIYKELTKD